MEESYKSAFGTHLDKVEDAKLGFGAVNAEDEVESRIVSVD